MSSLPNEIITELLIRLPTKSLLRFRLVSKSWCAQIDSTEFINLHLSHSIACGSNHSPVTLFDDLIYCLHSDPLTNLVKIGTPTPYENIGLCNTYTCNGVLLLQADAGMESETLILYNPSTRKHLDLPSPPPHNSKSSTVQGSYYLGSSSLFNDFKVFNILDNFDDDNDVTMDARIYSLKSGSWRTVQNFAEGINFDGILNVYVSGALHRIDKDNDTILALDVEKEEFKFISMPHHFKDKVVESWAHYFDGCLAVSRQNAYNQIRIWVMKEYGVKESWSLLLTMDSEYTFIDPIIPLIYKKSRTEVLLYNDGQLFWYDLQRKTLGNKLELNGLPKSFVQVSVDSLVSVGASRKTTAKETHHEKEKNKVEISKKRDDFLSKGFKLKL